MVTIYHDDAPAASDGQEPALEALELAGIVLTTSDLNEAFDLTIHRDGENWTDNPEVRFFGDRRSRRSSREGDVFVAGDGTAYRVRVQGFQIIPHLALPFL